MHALVTGGGGFLGRYIVEQLLARGDRVRSFSRGSYPELQAMGVEVIRGDVTDRAAVATACKDIECVFHTAANPGIGMDWRSFERVNVNGSLNVVEGCRRERVPRLVFTSSPSVTFAGCSQNGVNEEAPCNIAWMAAHRAHYSLSKALAESAVLAADCDELRTCALRPHLIWGPRDSHLIPRLIARARRGRLRRVGDGANLVDICFVENAATAHLQAADALSVSGSPASGRAYYISQGAPVNCWAWIARVLALAELPPVHKSISFTAAWRLGAAFECLYRLMRCNGEPPMTRFLAAQLACSHWFDISAARRDFGYEPKISTAEGMHRLAMWLTTSDDSEVLPHRRGMPA